jgi:hypothetical protein
MGLCIDDVWTICFNYLIGAKGSSSKKRKKKMNLLTPPKTITKTTLQLSAGDVILTGNCVVGFDTYTIVNLQPAHMPRRMIVTIQFNHGGTCDLLQGKNTRYAVITTKETK